MRGASPQRGRIAIPAVVGPAGKTMQELTTAQRIVDWTVLEELLGGRQGRLREFALKFVASTEADLVRIDDALARGDLPQLKKLGHHLKSPAAMIGATGLAELAIQLEAQEGSIEQSRTIVHQLHDMLGRIRAEIGSQFP